MSRNRDELISHREELLSISTKHFRSRRRVINAVAAKQFESASAVFGRHGRHLQSDLLHDTLNPLKSIWNSIANRISPTLKLRIKKTDKEREVKYIIVNDLLALQTLQERLSDYVRQHIAKSSRKLKNSLKHWSSEERSRIINIAMQETDKLFSDTKRLRTAASVLLATAAGSLLADQIKLGAFAAGGAAATSAYTASLSFPALLWSKVFGVPTYVAVLGGVGGVIVTLGIAPLIFPLAEFAVNRFRARQMLSTIVDNAENRLTSANSKVVIRLSSLCSYYDQVITQLSRMAVPNASASTRGAV